MVSRARYVPLQKLSKVDLMGFELLILLTNGSLFLANPIVKTDGNRSQVLRKDKVQIGPSRNP